MYFGALVWFFEAPDKVYTHASLYAESHTIKWKELKAKVVNIYYTQTIVCCSVVTVSTVTNILWIVQGNAMQKQGRVPSGFSILLIVWTDCGYKGGSHEVAVRITIEWEEAEVVNQTCIVKIRYICTLPHMYGQEAQDGRARRPSCHEHP